MDPDKYDYYFKVHKVTRYFGPGHGTERVPTGEPGPTLTAEESRTLVLVKNPILKPDPQTGEPADAVNPGTAEVIHDEARNLFRLATEREKIDQLTVNQADETDRRRRMKKNAYDSSFIAGLADALGSHRGQPTAQQIRDAVYARVDAEP